MQCIGAPCRAAVLPLDFIPGCALCSGAAEGAVMAQLRYLLQRVTPSHGAGVEHFTICSP